jgi:ATP phosphoribosyltransferase regulatory subunit
MTHYRWMLPDGVEETLPPQSWAMEALRRRLLDHYRDRGYQLILPPLIEHLDSLLTGSAEDLDRQTFKWVDPASGRLLGLRADMTPQAARIAARHFADQPVVRLCYLGSVLRAESDAFAGTRSPRQAGCEIFGEPGLEGDLEALDLMLETLELAGVRGGYLDLGHVGVYRGLIASLGLSDEDEALVFDLVQRKSQPDLADWLRAGALPKSQASGLMSLLGLHGDASVLSLARERLRDAGDGVLAALDQLQAVVEALAHRQRQRTLHLDLAELRGYRYKTGLVFAAFVPGHGRELARGGRYDGIGAAFGEARPATGFSADVNALLRLADVA